MITNKLFKDLVAYFEAKENPTEQEKDFLAEIKPYDDAFPVCFVTKEDLAAEGYDPNVSDETMDRIADRMGDTIGESGYYREGLIQGAQHFGVDFKETYYQPLIPTTEHLYTKWIMPDGLNDWEVFHSEEAAEDWLRDNGYDPLTANIQQYHGDDIEEHTYLDEE